MAQQPTNDFNIDPETDSGTELAKILNRWHEVIRTMNSGSTRPVDALAGSLWLETDPTNDPIQTIYFYDGNSDLAMAEINVTTHALAIPYADDNFAALAATLNSFTGAIKLDTYINIGFELDAADYSCRISQSGAAIRITTKSAGTAVSHLDMDSSGVVDATREDAVVPTPSANTNLANVKFVNDKFPAITGGTFTTTDGKTVTYNSSGLITSVV